MLDALSAAEYLEPTAVQAGLIPRVLDGADVMGQARTGTGKTAAFAIPLLEMLHHERRHSPQALVLVPTRELAVQVRDETVKLSKGRRTRTVALYGGKPIRGQIEKLRRGADIIVGTPGRVLDHIGRGSLQLNGLKFVVLDEADRMLDIGFRPDIERILRHCPRQRQTLLLSATVPPPVQRLAQRYMHEPESLNFSPKEISGDTIEQFYFTVDQDRKFELLDRLLKRENPKQAIVFCRTKRGTDRVANRLRKRHKHVDCIHGDLPQQARDRVMAKFRACEVRILVATDVVGRGIDVTGISHIINYDIPQFCDDYVHRVGRTGRMSKAGVAEGIAYTFVTPEEGSELTRIEMRIDKLLGRDEIEGFQTQAQTAAAAAEQAGQVPADASKPAEEKKPAPPGKRPPRRIRRAL
jgi:ATP-dependent RNA helicase DeaD